MGTRGWKTTLPEIDSSLQKILGRSDKMPRKVRSDKRIGNVEKDLGLPPGSFRNPDGRDTRSDKKVGTVRKELGKK
jgi:hypothetical protein